jgi:hypothetical protein
MSKHSLPEKENEQYLHEHLTEDSIRHVALRFLKTYYKYRPRQGETTAGKNLTTKSGLVVDGYLSFQTDEDKPFLATLEASSYSKRGEVKYTKQTRILFWDALAFGSLAGLLLFSYGYAYNHFTINQLGLFGSFGILFGTMLLVFCIVHLIAKGFSRYRYIYAVEQFKRYSADEQWIAIGEDVFPATADKHMTELKNQCVYNGFGLVMVNKDFEPTLMITPARKAVIKGRKQIFKVFSDNRLRKAMRKTPLEKVWTKIKDGFGKLRSKSPLRSADLMRYQRKFWKQAAVVLICFGLLGGIMYRELEEADIVHVDNKIYQDEMAKVTINSRPETDKYIIDTAALRQPTQTEIDLYNQQLADLQDDEIVEKGKKIETVDYQAKRLLKKDIKKTEEVMVYYRGEFIYYDCTRFFGFSGQKYVVTDGIYGNLDIAKKRIRQLAKIGINSNAFWVGCFDKAQGYVIYYDQIYNEKSTAERAARAFWVQFEQEKLRRGKVGIMVLER